MASNDPSNGTATNALHDSVPDTNGTDIAKDGPVNSGSQSASQTSHSTISSRISNASQLDTGPLSLNSQVVSTTSIPRDSTTVYHPPQIPAPNGERADNSAWPHPVASQCKQTRPSNVAQNGGNSSQKTSTRTT